MESPLCGKDKALIVTIGWVVSHFNKVILVALSKRRRLGQAVEGRSSRLKHNPLWRIGLTSSSVSPSSLLGCTVRQANVEVGCLPMIS